MLVWWGSCLPRSNERRYEAHSKPYLRLFPVQRSKVTKQWFFLKTVCLFLSFLSFFGKMDVKWPRCVLRNRVCTPKPTLHKEKPKKEPGFKNSTMRRNGLFVYYLLRLMIRAHIKEIESSLNIPMIEISLWAKQGQFFCNQFGLLRVHWPIPVVFIFWQNGDLRWIITSPRERIRLS